MSNPRSEALAGQRLAELVAGTRSDDLPPELRHEARRAILNFIAAALAAATDPAIDAALRVISPSAGPAEATVLGRTERLDAPNAAFANAVAGNLLDFDDTHLPTVIHPSAPVGPPVLALAEQRGRSGAEAIAAFVLGAEIACRLGRSVSPDHYARGWHITTTCGVFGAAAASARLLGLDAERTGHALGIAASQSAGVVENLAVGAKNVSIGNSARNGLLAARFAEEGFAAAPAAIEGPLGWAAAGGAGIRVAELTADLGERWEFASNTYKPYPCGIVMHAVIDACLELAARAELTDRASAERSIVEVTVRGDALLLARGDRVVKHERDARVSLHHAAAVALLFGTCGLREFSEPVVSDPAVVAMRGKVIAQCDPSLPIGAASVSLRTASDTVHEASVHHARGSIARPLTDREIETKLMELARLHPGGIDAERLIEAAWGLERAPGVDELMRAATPLRQPA